MGVRRSVFGAEGRVLIKPAPSRGLWEPVVIRTRRCRVAGGPAVPEAGALTLVLLVVLAMFVSVAPDVPLSPWDGGDVESCF